MVTKHTIKETRESLNSKFTPKYLYITYETDDSDQLKICKEYIEDFANDFEERFINPPVKPVDYEP